MLNFQLSIMNKYIIGTVGFLAMLLPAGCSSDANDMPANGNSPEMREINVNMSSLKRTSIEYDNADLSHLVWSEGDKVAYISDADGDVCREATITGNRFTAEVPADLTEGKLHIIYPVGDNVGKTLADMRMSVASAVTQDVTAAFEGTTLPMTAHATVSESSSVNADFEFPASVLRLRLKVAADHDAEEIIESVTLSAAEDAAGSYAFQGDKWVFTGSSKTITTTFAGSQKLVDMKANGEYVYIVMNGASYTDVDLVIKTSAGLYKFDDGTMDLAQEGRTLYHVDLTLSEAEPEPEPRYKKIVGIDDLTTNATDSYLIVCESNNMLFCNYNSSNYHDGVSISIPADGLDPANEDIKKRACVIAPAGDENPGLYTLKFEGIRSSAPYIRCMANFSATPGKLNFTTDLTSGKRAFWGITFDSEGNVLLQAHPNTQDTAGDVFLGFDSDKNSKAFCTYGPDAPAGRIAPIQLYKLVK